jgi:hypothetical protein
MSDLIRGGVKELWGGGVPLLFKSNNNLFFSLPLPILDHNYSIIFLYNFLKNYLYWDWLLPLIFSTHAKLPNILNTF